MSGGISPIHITAAALITQFSLMLIMFIASVILRSGERSLPPWREGPSYPAFPWLILGCALLTIGFLFFSDEFSASWKPLFGEIGFSGLSWSSALLIMFLGDIVLIAMLVAGTGGSAESAFSPLYFALPTLAIFLREPLTRLIIYVTLVAICYSAGLFLLRSLRDEVPVKFRQGALCFVSLACLILATFIGYVTRPR